MSKKRASSQLRKTVAERAHGCCEYCRSQAQFTMQPFSIEHIMPRIQGGKTILSNLALACQGCNNHKYTKFEGRDPVTGKRVPLYHPREQQWSDHFTWNDDFSLVIGITPTGRATVEELSLNRDGLINLRKILYEVGEHPPVQVDLE